MSAPDCPEVLALEHITDELRRSIRAEGGRATFCALTVEHAQALVRLGERALGFVGADEPVPYVVTQPVPPQVGARQGI